jgi:hypothetical protein
VLFLSSLSEASAKSWLGASEILLLIASLVLVIGIIGEWPDSVSWKRSTLYKLAKAAVVIGVVGEMLGDAGIFETSARLESLREAENTKLKIVANEARIRAANAEKEAAEASRRLQVNSMERWLFFSGAKCNEALDRDHQPKSEIVWLRSNTEAKELAGVIGSCLGGHDGMSWKRIARLESIDQLPEEIKSNGITVIGKNPGRWPFETTAPMDFIAKALTAGMEEFPASVRTVRDPSLPDDLVRIFVGSK